MAIHKLPDYLINRLKAGEVVQRPSSILKELVENSLDAGATQIEIALRDGGKSFLSVQDNGSGIELADMDLVLERYATSKIQTDEDLYTIASYGFRGEALASIAEVSKLTLLSKTAYAQIATKLVKKGGEILMTHQPVGFEKGTFVSVEDLFFNVPARLKFLKSHQTEFFYCHNYFIDIATQQYDKERIFKKQEKVILHLPPAVSLLERILAIFKQDWKNYLKPLKASAPQMQLQGLIGDANLRFRSRENIRTYVNGRPVQDKVLMKAIMETYRRQIKPGEYPFVVLDLQLDPQIVDVNVHPAKLNVKFADAQAVFQLVHTAISQALGQERIANYHFPFTSAETAPSSASQATSSFAEEASLPPSPSSTSSSSATETLFSAIVHKTPQVQGMFGLQDFTDTQPQRLYHPEVGDYQIIGQLRNTYILMQGQDAFFSIDQHALAERIAFEGMKQTENLTPEALLQPLKFEISLIADLSQKIEQLNQLGFEISMLGERTMVMYAVPKVFVTYPIDMQVLLNYVLYQQTISFDLLMEGVYASRACKTSIKAGHKLSLAQMEQLVSEGLEKIPGLFVCQHGRPFFWKWEKKEIEKLFSR